MGSLGGILYAYDRDDGTLLTRLNARGPLGSAPSIVDGSLYVGAGTGERGGNPTRIAYLVSLFPSTVNAFCVAGVDGCPATESCDDGNACTIDAFDGTSCSSSNAPNGTACSIGINSGSCDAGRCILTDLVCPNVSQCSEPYSAGDSCRYQDKPDGTPCTARNGAGQCLAGNCVSF
jgi:outer membrane protein assembly factor BamB